MSTNNEFIGKTVTKAIAKTFFMWKRWMQFWNIWFMLFYFIRLMYSSISTYMNYHDFSSFLPLLLDLLITPITFLYPLLYALILTKPHTIEKGKTYSGMGQVATYQQLKKGWYYSTNVALVVYLGLLFLDGVWTVFNIVHYSILIYFCGNAAAPFYGKTHDWSTCVVSRYNPIIYYAWFGVMGYCIILILKFIFQGMYTLSIFAFEVNPSLWEKFDKLGAQEITAVEIGEFIVAGKVKLSNKMKKILELKTKEFQLMDSEDEEVQTLPRLRNQ